ncbi:MAG: PEGA domain-containing protein [Verrucomicrobia bacterium]|nr:PEGA domain-containing protein [Verrucomicrobiota bacterium]MCH8511461.1 PEGA domain-containing protein [Kiritimatiellia bacterium]
MKNTAITFLTSLLVLLGTGCDPQDQSPTGELFISSEPSDARVEVNGEFLGTTPLNVRVPSGKLLVSVRRDGYQTERMTLNLPTGSQVARDLNLRRLSGLVLIDSDPPGAAVSIGDVFRGNTPLAMHNIRLGEHRARLVMQGYDDREIEFTVEDRIPRRVDVDMVSNSGSLIVHSNPSGATVYVDGRNEGSTPVSLDRVQQGERDLVVELNGYADFRRTVSIVAGESARVTAELSARPGSLRVVTIPSGARIYVNDVFKGESPVAEESIAPGAYVVRAELRGHADQARTVRVDRGESVVQEFRMERNSGTLEIVTRPALVRVIVNGEFMGTTRPRDQGTDAVSEPLQVEMLSQGAHRLQLVREGYNFESKRFMITMDEVTTLDETLRRIFIPNTILRIGSRPDDAIIGRLVRRHADGSVEMEIREGIFRTYPAEDIISIEPLREEQIPNN